MTRERRVRHAAWVAAAAALVVLASSAMSCAARPANPTASVPEAVLHWQAREEAGVYGYLVFRADRPEGPFLRKSKEIIHASPEGSEVSSYTFVDRDVQPGRTYFYSLDVVQNSGQKRRFSDVLSKTVPR